MKHYTIVELRSERRRFEEVLRTAGLAENTIFTYTGRTDIFLRWLAGEYEPRGPVMPRPRRRPAPR